MFPESAARSCKEAAQSLIKPCQIIIKKILPYFSYNDNAFLLNYIHTLDHPRDTDCDTADICAAPNSTGISETCPELIKK
jgi:hypothetical protein